MKAYYTLLMGILFALTSCEVYVVEPVYEPAPIVYGPDGSDGLAFFGVDYTRFHPYSYWDNNPEIGENPPTRQAFQTFPGVYEFEYFIDEYDYWFGTYEIYVNAGEPGRVNGFAGRDGADTYLWLFCDPEGPTELHESGKNDKSGVKISNEGKVTVIEHSAYKIKLQKTNVQQRKPKGKVTPY